MYKNRLIYCVLFVSFIIVLIKDVQLVPIRDFIVNGTSAKLFTGLPSFSDIHAGTLHLPLEYSTTSFATLYPNVQTYTGYSTSSTKKAANFMGMFNIICGGYDYLNIGGGNYESNIVCYSFDHSCSSFFIAPTQAINQSISPYTISNKVSYTSVPPIMFRSSKTPDGVIIPNSYTNNVGLLFPAYLRDAGGSVFMTLININNVSSSGIDFVTNFAIPLAGGTPDISPVVFSDYDLETLNISMSYVHTFTATFSAYNSDCVGINCTIASTLTAQITGYTLLNHYPYAEGLKVPLPVFILSNSTTIVLATAKNGDITLAAGLTVLSTAPIVGCVPDQGTIINWNNTANPYANTVHLYTMCNMFVTNNTIGNSSAVYEIAYTNTTLTFTRQQALPNLYTAVDLQVIGEYGQILTTNDGKGTNPVTTTPGLYSLYDPYNPVYIGYASLSNSISINPNNTVGGGFFSISGDISRNVCPSSSPIYFLTMQMFNGLNMATLNFCGSGDTQYNNLTYCDGPGSCCGDNCTYFASGAPCNITGNSSICTPGFCQSSNANCVSNVTNGTFCGNSTGICYDTSLCYDGFCDPVPFGNGTIKVNETSCQYAFYCDGHGNLIGGGFKPPTTICNIGNLTGCINPSYCLGNSSACPANTNAADFTPCSNVTTCGNYTNVCISQQCLPNPFCNNCTSVYPCANYTEFIGNVCTPFGIKPYGFVCDASQITPSGSCIIPGGFCNGFSTQCIGTTAQKDGTLCSIVVDALCNATGICLSGSCNVQNPCPSSSIITENFMFSTTSYLPSLADILLTSIIIGSFIFIMTIIVIISRFV